MHALKKTRKLMSKGPETETARVLSQLILALESETPFKLSLLDQLDSASFQLAMDILKDWRTDRRFTSKALLLDLSMHIDTLASAKASLAAAPKTKFRR